MTSEMKEVRLKKSEIPIIFVLGKKDVPESRGGGKLGKGKKESQKSSRGKRPKKILGCRRKDRVEKKRNATELRKSHFAEPGWKNNNGG